MHQYQNWKITRVEVKVEVGEGMDMIAWSKEAPFGGTWHNADGARWGTMGHDEEGRSMKIINRHRYRRSI